MKTLVLITSLLLTVAPFTRAADSPKAPSANPKGKDNPKAPGKAKPSVDDEIAALKAKYPILHDAASVAKEKKFKEAAARLNADPEIQKLLEEMKKAFYAADGHQKAFQANQALLKKEREKILAVHPDLKDYVDAKLEYRREMDELLRQRAADPADKEKIKQQFQ